MCIYIIIVIIIIIIIMGIIIKPPEMKTDAPIGWRYLSNATSLMRPHLFYACFTLSRIIVLMLWQTTPSPPVKSFPMKSP